VFPLDFEIRTSTEDGDSVYSDKHCSLRRYQTSEGISLLLRVLLAKLNPRMLDAGERLLQEGLAEHPPTSDGLPKEQHPWFRAFQHAKVESLSSIF
jgi:hypothetical protein